ncbi:MAG: HD domain-containing protein [Candidatus Micrarchaeia archaeon]
MDRMENLKDYAIKFLSGPEFAKHYYHNEIHTLDVYRSASRYAKLEKLGKEETEMLLAAALLHDFGYAKRYDKNEPDGAEMAGAILPKYGFNVDETRIVQHVILETEFPQHPSDKLGYIICDADLDILGTSRFMKRTMDLKREIEEVKGIKYTNAEWYKSQIKLLESHEFFTKSARTLRSKGQETNLEKLKALLRIEESSQG